MSYGRTALAMLFALGLAIAAVPASGFESPAWRMERLEPSAAAAGGFRP